MRGNSRSNCARWKTTALPRSRPTRPAKFCARLAEAEAGRWQAWWQLTYYLMLTPESRAFGDELDYFVTAMPGWGEADESLRRRIVACAERYLAEAETSIDAWLGREPMPVYRNAIAGLRAFILLKHVSPEGYARIADATWRKWAPGDRRTSAAHRDRQIARNRPDFDRCAAPRPGGVRRRRSHDHPA